jgi:hypothetical protein
MILIQLLFTCRDPVYFDDNWLNRIKTEVGDNWRLKVFLFVFTPVKSSNICAV